MPNNTLTPSPLQPPKHRRRWYDQEISCTRLIEQIRGMYQPTCQEFCARVLIHVAEKLRKEILQKTKHSAKVSSIGASGIAGLYNFGHESRRWYDQHPTIQKAVGSLYGLPLEGLTVVGFKLGDTMGLIQVYSTVCEQIAQEPELEALAKICTTALQDGRSEAEEVLISIVGQDLYQSITQIMGE
ncbi:MAG TPA: hypothetical protein V6C99_08905 [Oculatellaceae cyanobacterium]|jgi:hypothetical protein